MALINVKDSGFCWGLRGLHTASCKLPPNFWVRNIRKTGLFGSRGSANPPAGIRRAQLCWKSKTLCCLCTGPLASEFLGWKRGSWQIGDGFRSSTGNSRRPSGLASTGIRQASHRLWPGIQSRPIPNYWDFSGKEVKHTTRDVTLQTVEQGNEFYSTMDLISSFISAKIEPC